MKEFIILIASLMSIVAISIDATLPALGVISRDLNITNPNHAQFIIGFIFLGMTIGQLICGPVSDAIGRKKILYFGLSVYLLGSIICFLSASLTMILIGRFIQGIGVSGPYVAAVSIVRDKYSGRDMARIMSLVMMIFILVPAIAPSIGQGILLVASWRAIFVLYIFYAILLLGWLSLRLEETLPPEKRISYNLKNFLHGLKEIINNRVTICYAICMGITFGGLIGYLNSSQQIFQMQFETGNMFAVYFGLLASVIGVASLLNSRIVQKYGMRYICRRSTLVIIIASGMFLIYAAILFFSFGMMFGNLNAIAMEPMGHIAGIASALIGAGSSVISLFLGTMIGQLYDGTLTPVTLGFLGLGIISLAIMRFAEGARIAGE